MFYEYVCGACGGLHESQTFARIGESLPTGTCRCGGDLIRAASIPNTTPISTLVPTFNHTVGNYVTGTRDFERQLHESERRMSERLGYDQRFTPIYPSEAKAYNEKAASNDGQQGQSVERYGTVYNRTDHRKTIIT